MAKIGVGEDVAGDAGAVNGRIGIYRTDEDLDLGLDAGFLFATLADDGEGANAFAVEALLSLLFLVN